MNTAKVLGLRVAVLKLLGAVLAEKGLAWAIAQGAGRSQEQVEEGAELPQEHLRQTFWRGGLSAGPQLRTAGIALGFPGTDV